MKITNVTDWTKMNATSKKGDIRASFSDLVKAFGNPTSFDEENTDKEAKALWILEIDGYIVTIYDRYTCGSVYDNYDWNVGGHDAEVMDLLRELDFEVAL
ncbi:MAG: hypothetical protein GY938_13185 [Ketobacter sp.]|nr:hypothetical protein [Ketobacter sp.]